MQVVQVIEKLAEWESSLLGGAYLLIGKDLEQVMGALRSLDVKAAHGIRALQCNDVLFITLDRSYQFFQPAQIRR